MRQLVEGLLASSRGRRCFSFQWNEAAPLSRELDYRAFVYVSARANSRHPSMFSRNNSYAAADAAAAAATRTLLIIVVHPKDSIRGD